MSERVPEGWTQSRVTNFVNVGRGYAFKRFDYHFTGNPIVRVTNISDSNGLDLSNDVVYLKKERATEFQSYQLKDDDFLLVMVGATIGKYAKVSTQGKLLFLNQNMWRLSVIDKQTQSQKFAIYGLQKVIEEFLRTMQGSAREFLTQKEFGKATLILPPLPEQKKIASILTSVDEVIESTQKQIDKLQDLKKATMNRLLTKGIGHTKFKDSDMGRIPKSWEVRAISAASSLITKGATPTTSGHAYIENGINFYRSVNASEDGQLKNIKVKHISLKANKSLRRSVLRLDDVVISIVGAKTGKTFFCITKESELPGNINQNVALIRPTERLLNSRFLSYTFVAPYFQKQVDRELTTQAQPCLSLKQVGEFCIKIPTYDEQIKIVEKLDSLSQTLSKKRSKSISLGKLKKSLMQDLLTGKVRVQVN